MTNPLAHLRRTPLRRMLETAGARWHPLADTALAHHVGTQDGSGAVLIADLTPLPRLGFKGRGTIEAIKERGVVVDAVPNMAFRQPDGGLCLVLAPGEVILLSNLAGDGGSLDQMFSSWRLEDEERTYPLLRRDSHAWFMVSSVSAPAMFAKVCAIDLRPEKFPDLAIAQTSVAKMPAILVRADTGNRVTYHILADSAAAMYLCTCLIDAAKAFGGQLAGLKDVEGTRGQ